MNKFSESQIKLFLGDCGTGSDITSVLESYNFNDNSGESTKRRRPYSIFIESQNKYYKMRGRTRH